MINRDFSLKKKELLNLCPLTGPKNRHETNCEKSVKHC